MSVDRDWLTGFTSAAQQYLEALENLSQYIDLDAAEPAEEVAAEYTAANVREWAAAAHMACPERGRIPQRVLDAYLESRDEVRS